jgi:hypothetical protein
LLVWLNLDPRWKRLRSEPCFGSLMKKVGLVWKRIQRLGAVYWLKESSKFCVKDLAGCRDNTF